MGDWFPPIIIAFWLSCVGAMPVTYGMDQPPSWAFDSASFHSETYILLAAKLQALGREGAALRLHAIAKDKQSPGRAIILARMLFKKRESDQFRRPFVGAAVFMGGTNYSDWPLEPIEIVNGVPFLVTRGYFLAGKAESDEEYLSYCEAHADWNDQQYAAPSKQVEQAALATLVTSPRWKTPLTEEEKQFLVHQIE